MYLIANEHCVLLKGEHPDYINAVYVNVSTGYTYKAYYLVSHSFSCLALAHHLGLGLINPFIGCHMSQQLNNAF